MKKQLLFLTAIAISGFIIRFLFIYHEVKHPAIWVLPFTHFESILIGIVLGLLDFNAMANKRVSIILITALAGCIILLLPGTGVISYQLMILYPCVGVFTGGVLYISVTAKDRYLKKILTSPLLSYLGKISFGLYIFHSICIITTDYAFRKLFYSNHPLLTNIVALLFTVLVAALSYSILEKPFLRLKKKFTIIPSR